MPAPWFEPIQLPITWIHSQLFLNLFLLKFPIHLTYSQPIPSQQEKIQRTEEKRCTVNHVAEFVKRNSDSQRTEVQRYTEVKLLRCTERCTERSDLRSLFLLLFWSSVSTPLLEFRFYSSFGVQLLLLFWSSVTTPLLELHYYSSFGAPLLYSSFGALLLLLFN